MKIIKYNFEAILGYKVDLSEQKGKSIQPLKHSLHLVTGLLVIIQSYEDFPPRVTYDPVLEFQGLHKTHTERHTIVTCLHVEYLATTSPVFLVTAFHSQCDAIYIDILICLMTATKKKSKIRQIHLSASTYDCRNDGSCRKFH